MAAFGNLFGPNGVIEQLVLWGVASKVIEALGAPGFTALQQNIQAKHPELALTPELAAAAVARHLMTEQTGREEAARGGINEERFTTLVQVAKTRLTPEIIAQAVERHLITEGQAVKAAELQGMDAAALDVLRQLAKVRLPPADLATAVLRSYMTKAAAEAEAAPQGITAEQLGILADLAGDAPGADQLVTAARRGIIPEEGRGADSVSYAQGIRETRLHDKWAPVLMALGRMPLSPADAASAVVRNFLPRQAAEAAAAESGIDAPTLATMILLSGDAPGPEQLAEALRRGAIERSGTGAQSTSFAQGIAEGRLADKWAPVIEDLAKLWPTPVDALNAALKGQIPAEEGKRLYELLGGDLQFYPWLLSSQGEGPTPLEAVQMANRGYIPWTGIGPEVTSYAQAVRESRFRDKWAPVYQKYATYLPEPETVRTLLEQGAIEQKTAVSLWHKSGLDEETVAAYLEAAAFNNSAAQRGLATSAILDMYYSQLIGQTEARELLALFRIPAHTVDLLIGYALIRRDATAVTTAVRRVQTLLSSRKINAEIARQALTRLKIPDATIDGLISTWLVEASVNVKLLTEAQIAEAFQIGILDQSAAQAELEAIGYTAFDAWTLLSIKMKQALPNQPARITAVPLADVTPGVT